MTDVLPPRLSRGRHASPSHGTCLMELASLLAGEPWTDHPACVHPVLGAVARAVNDRVDDAGRARLAPLVPAMIGTADDDLRSYARIALLPIGTALATDQAGCRHPDVCCQLESAQRLARAVLLGRARILRRLYARIATAQAAFAVAVMDSFTSGERAALCELLEDCVAVCRAELPPVGTLARYAVRSGALPSALSR